MANLENNSMVLKEKIENLKETVIQTDEKLSKEMGVTNGK